MDRIAHLDGGVDVRELAENSKSSSTTVRSSKRVSKGQAQPPERNLNKGYFTKKPFKGYKKKYTKRTSHAHDENFNDSNEELSQSRIKKYPLTLKREHAKALQGQKRPKKLKKKYSPPKKKKK